MQYCGFSQYIYLTVCANDWSDAFNYIVLHVPILNDTLHNTEMYTNEYAIFVCSFYVLETRANQTVISVLPQKVTEGETYNLKHDSHCVNYLGQTSAVLLSIIACCHVFLY